MDTEKRLEELTKLVGNLHESIDAKFSAGKADREKEIDSIIDTVIEKLNPPKRAMEWAVNSKNEETSKIHLGQFLKAVSPGGFDKVSPEVAAHIKTTLTGGTPATAGYTVPVDYSDRIIELEQGTSIMRNLCELFPMSTLTRHLPKQLTDVAITWASEGVNQAAAETNPTFGRVTQTAKKAFALVKMTEELLADNNVGVDNFIMKLVAKAMGREEDRLVLVGDVSGLSDPFNGVLYASGVNSTSTAGANVVGDDVINMLLSLSAEYREGATLLTSTHGLRLLMKLKTSDDEYIWSKPTDSTPSKIWGYDYKISDRILSTYGTGTQTAMLFGQWKNVFMSDRGAYEVNASDSAADFTNSQSAFLEDEIWYKFSKRMSIDVANAAGMAKMLVE